jgi:hypothetical protein
MSYTGYVREGVVVFDGERPSDGAKVTVEELCVPKQQPPTWGEVFESLVGSVEGLPEDMSDQHDHYIHGSPKR